MKRRQFFKNAAFASAGVGLVAAGAKANNSKSSTECSTVTFKGSKTNSPKGDILSVDVWFCPSSVKSLQGLSEEDKVLQVRFILIENETEKVHQGKYLMTSATAPADASDKRTIVASRQAVLKNEFLPSGDLDLAKMTFLYDFTQVTRKVSILDKKGNTYIELKEYDEFEDCFLTTACVYHRGLPDDCDELQGLRRFRDEVLIKSEEGIRLVKEYYEIAPPIVKAISASPHKDVVFEGIYSDMILPTLRFIETGNPEAAVSHYKNYTLMLRESFGNVGN